MRHATFPVTIPWPYTRVYDTHSEGYSGCHAGPNGATGSALVAPGWEGLCTLADTGIRRYTRGNQLQGAHSGTYTQTPARSSRGGLHVRYDIRCISKVTVFCVRIRRLSMSLVDRRLIGVTPLYRFLARRVTREASWQQDSCCPPHVS